MMNIGLLTVLLVSLAAGPKYDKENSEELKKLANPPYLVNDKGWTDSVINTMTTEEKIGQLFMIAAYSNRDAKHVNYINKLVKDYKIGGLIFMQGHPSKQINLLNKYQKSAKIPLMVAMDAEWGPSMRLDSTVLYPRQMMLGAVNNNEIIYNTGAEYARQLKKLGVNINFAPVADINVNPANPVINSRAYGEDRMNVFTKSYHFSKGMQDNNVMAVAKHFPGHGDTEIDSHKALPSIMHELPRLDSIELFPFRKLVNAGIGGVMIAHLYVPSLDSESKKPSTLSKKIVNGMLKKQMGFEGLIFTDALNMKAVSDNYDTGETELMAYQAGNDILLFPQDVPKAVKKIKAAIDSGQISMKELNKRVEKILAAKKWMGLFESDTLKNENINKDLNSPAAKLIRRQIVENAITLVKNNKNILPVMDLNRFSIASLDFGSGKINAFQKKLKDYENVPAYSYNSTVKNLGKDGLVKEFSQKDLLIISVTGTNRSPSRNFGLNKEEIQMINRLCKETNVVLNLFGNPYALRNTEIAKNCSSLIISYNDREITQEISAQMLFGGLAFKGRLPVSISEDYPAGTGFDTEKNRLSFTEVPEEVGINSEKLYKVDSFLNEAVKEKATPGGQVLVARHGKIFYNKSFGYHTYQKRRKVKNSDIYDLASVTKIIASTASMMKLYDEQKFRLNDELGTHLEFAKGTNKEHIKLKDILTHQARLKPWIPFYTETIKKNYDKFYKKNGDRNHAMHVARDMFCINSIRDSILNEIIESDLRNRNGYRYSDLGFYLVRELIEDKTGIPLEEYADSVFYKPLGAKTMGYNPLQRFSESQIVPTENDQIFRKQTLRGYVHDQGAAMLGGVSGHAGVFSNSLDLAKMMQMFLNKGNYGDKRYISEETIQLFSSPLSNPSENRRGIGFDKPVPDNPGTEGPACKSASPKSFGHAGFTGILAWADPETDLIYIFISNRVYPDMENRKLIKLNTRTNVQQVFYDAIIDSCL